MCGRLDVWVSVQPQQNHSLSPETWVYDNTDVSCDLTSLGLFNWNACRVVALCANCVISKINEILCLFAVDGLECWAFKRKGRAAESRVVFGATAELRVPVLQKQLRVHEREKVKGVCVWTSSADGDSIGAISESMSTLYFSFSLPHRRGAKEQESTAENTMSSSPRCVSQRDWLYCRSGEVLVCPAVNSNVSPVNFTFSETHNLHQHALTDRLGYLHSSYQI